MEDSQSELEALRHQPLVFVADLAVMELDDADRAHLERSLRLRPGTAITVADGQGRWRSARLGPTIEADGEIITGDRPTPTLTIGFAVVKGDRSDLVVQKLTELGIDRIVPVLSERSVVRWDEKRRVKNLERHRRIAREAAMQSRNLWLPNVEPATELSHFLTDSGPDNATDPGSGEVIMADPSGPPPAASATTMAIGPEGGFSAEELADRPTASLPGRILRTETAAITAAVLLVNNRAQRFRNS